MQIASFILISDRLLRTFEEQLERTLPQMPSPNLAFINMVPARLQELGTEHPISITLGSLFPLDKAAGRQHERIFSTFEDVAHPSRIGRMAASANVPLYYVSPGRVRDFVRELETLQLQKQLHPEDVEALIGRRISREELPAVVKLIEQFRRDLYQVYADAALEGKGVVVLVVSQADEITSEEGFPRAA